MKIRAWLKITLAISTIVAFIKWSPLVFNKSDTYREITKKSVEMGIDNAALFYTEEKHSEIAEQNMKLILKKKDNK